MKISFKEFMKRVLYGSDGFYTTSGRITAEGGHFITPSNFSFALSFFIKKIIEDKKKEFGRDFKICEIGGGEGIFALNFLSITDWNYIFVEKSSSLMSSAVKKLNILNHKNIEFYDDIIKVGKFKGFIVAIELFDAFPFSRFIYRNSELFEIYVDVDNFKEFEVKIREPEFLKKFKKMIKEGVEFEFSDEIISFLSVLSEKFERGYFILIDYADTLEELMKRGGSARVFNRHRVSRDFYKDVKKADITRTLNADFLIEKFRMNNFSLLFYGTLLEFLTRAGVEEVIRKSEDLSVKFRVKFISQLNYLISPDAMGEVYKVFVFKK